jgi:hypothetical protein
MPKKRFSSKQIIAKLRQIEVQLAQGKSVALACKDAAVSEQSYFLPRNLPIATPSHRVGQQCQKMLRSDGGLGLSHLC